MEGTQKNWNDIMSQWMNLQQTVWREWIGFTGKSMEAMMSMGKAGAASSDGIDSPWKVYENWFDSFRKMFEDKGRDGLGSTVFNRVFSASRVYLDLLDFWSKSLGSFKSISVGEPLSVENIKEIRGQWIKQYQSMMESLWGGMPSAEVRDTAEAMTSTSVAASNFMWDFIEPVFKNMVPLPEVMQRVVKGDRAAVADLGGIFVKNYEDTIGKALLAPSLGYFKEFNERINHMVNAYMEFNTAKVAFYSLFYDTGLRAAERVYEKFTEFAGKEVTPETFREFYRIWWTINEEVYEELFRSDEFSKLSYEVNRRGLLFRKWIDDVFEQVLKFTSLPSKRDMDEIYRSIYDLKKEVHSQKRAIKDVEKRLGVKASRSSR